MKLMDINSTVVAARGVEGEGDLIYKVTEDNLTLGGGYRVQYTDLVT